MPIVCSDDATHKSTTADFCSVCGAPISGATAVPAGAGSNSSPDGSRGANQSAKEIPPPRPASGHSAAASAGACPSCGIARIAGDVFCANCGTEYATGRQAVPEPEPRPEPQPVLSSLDPRKGSIMAPAMSPGQASHGSSSSAPGSAHVAHSLRAVLRVDLRPREGRPDEALPPDDQADRLFIMDKDVMPFGRTSAWMPVVDAGVSRHHGEFVRQPDGSYCVRDVGSANGTFLNGKQLQGQELRAIGSLDEIAFGFWHLIKIEP